MKFPRIGVGLSPPLFIPRRWTTRSCRGVELLPTQPVCRGRQSTCAKHGNTASKSNWRSAVFGSVSCLQAALPERAGPATCGSVVDCRLPTAIVVFLLLQVLTVLFSLDSAMDDGFGGGGRLFWCPLSLVTQALGKLPSPLAGRPTSPLVRLHFPPAASLPSPIPGSPHPPLGKKAFFIHPLFVFCVLLHASSVIGPGASRVIHTVWGPCGQQHAVSVGVVHSAYLQSAAVMDSRDGVRWGSSRFLAHHPDPAQLPILLAVALSLIRGFIIYFRLLTLSSSTCTHNT